MRPAGLTLPRLRGLRVQLPKDFTPDDPTMSKMRVEFRSNFLPETIRFTSSDYLDFGGFCVQIRDMPNEGEGGTGPGGRPYFSFGYRLFQEKGRRTVWFDQDPKHALTTNRIAVLLPPDRPYRWSWHNAGGLLASLAFTLRL